MAKTRLPDTAPAKNDVYVGMLLLTVLSIAVGIALLAMEGVEYDWQRVPSSGQKIELPGPRPAAPPAKADAALPADPAPVAAAPAAGAQGIVATAPPQPVTAAVPPTLMPLAAGLPPVVRPAADGLPAIPAPGDPGLPPVKTVK